VIEPTSFAFHVTYTCPLACAHCCFRSNPQNRDRLDVGLIRETIDTFDTDSIKLVIFTGGEPFLLGNRLADLVAHANARGLRTRIVSSGYFGRTRGSARRRLEPVIAAGLDELSLSWDDFHEEFVSWDTFLNVVDVATEYPDLVVAINSVQAATSKWNAIRIQEELDHRLGSGRSALVLNSPLNLTGRADDELRDAGLAAERLLGPCPYVMTGPTLSAKGKLLACCGVIPNTDRLTINASFEPARFEDDMRRAAVSPLYLWLYLRGPYGILEWFKETYDIVIPGRDTVGGNCQACKHLLENEEVEARLDAALAQKMPELWAEFCLLQSLSLSGPREMVSLWYRSGADTSPMRMPAPSPRSAD
jgi:hypothetical protein